MSAPRRPRKDPPPHRLNGQIKAEQVRLIDAEGEHVGIVTRAKALHLARESKLDLVQMSDNEPPVCRLLDYSKFRYQQERKAKEARKNRSKPPHQLRVRPAIADHDFQVRVRQAEKFLLKGDKVKVTAVFRGRQNSHPELGEAVLARMAQELADMATVEQQPRKEGNQMHMLLVPKPSAKPRGNDAPAAPPAPDSAAAAAADDALG